MTARVRRRARASHLMGAFSLWLLTTTALPAAPAIRTGQDNPVPACVSPERLMAFLRTKNPDVDGKYRDIARWYQHWGEAWNVRWDYAFFQMAIETNYLKYRRADGRRGDVHERQNNFAGLGATGGGVAGEKFRDVKTGVHAQIQHLVAYSGERVVDPVAQRTAEHQGDIIAKSRRLGRKVTFGDLARRWAADRHYAKSIDFVAGQFAQSHCRGPATVSEAPSPKPVLRTRRVLTAPSGLGGPKPQRLAGPESLPWTDETVVTQQQDGGPETPADPAPARKVTPKRPFRTIWSRQQPEQEPREERVPATPETASRDTMDPAQDSSVAGTTPVPITDAATPPGMPPATVAASPGIENAEAPSLPHFRIAPALPEPARLGGPVEVDDVEQKGAPRASLAVAASRPGVSHTACNLMTASFGGTKTMLVRARHSGADQYTALTVLEGFEQSMFETYAKTSPGLELVGTYTSRDEALAEGKRLCPENAGPQHLITVRSLEPAADR